MNLEATTIHLPSLIAQGTRKPWTGTLADLIAIDGDRLSQDADARGLPVIEAHDDDCPGRNDADDCHGCQHGEPRYADWTLADWRTATDDPNAELDAWVNARARDIISDSFMNAPDGAELTVDQYGDVDGIRIGERVLIMSECDEDEHGEPCNCGGYLWSEARADGSEDITDGFAATPREATEVYARWIAAMSAEAEQ